jgi:VIT1/CCC1 family predicted Fe2+/Mn2+ transporter
LFIAASDKDDEFAGPHVIVPGINPKKKQSNTIFSTISQIAISMLRFYTFLSFFIGSMGTVLMLLFTREDLSIFYVT